MSNAEKFLSANSGAPIRPAGNYITVPNAREYARLKSQEDNAELVEALMEVSPLLDGLINRTPTGKQREELCDMNIKVKSALAAHTPKG